MGAASVRTSLRVRVTLPGFGDLGSLSALEEEQPEDVADREEDQDHDRDDDGYQPHHRQEL